MKIMPCPLNGPRNYSGVHLRRRGGRAARSRSRRCRILGRLSLPASQRRRHRARVVVSRAHELLVQSRTGTRSPTRSCARFCRARSSAPTRVRTTRDARAPAAAGRQPDRPLPACGVRVRRARLYRLRRRHDRHAPWRRTARGACRARSSCIARADRSASPVTRPAPWCSSNPSQTSRPTRVRSNRACECRRKTPSAASKGTGRRCSERFERFLPVGFYYKAFYKPRGVWNWWEKIIRRTAGLGRVDRTWTPEYFRRGVRRNCDVVDHRRRRSRPLPPRPRAVPRGWT